MNCTTSNRLYLRDLKSQLVDALYDELNSVSCNPQISKPEQAQLSEDFAEAADYARGKSATGRINKKAVFNSYYHYLAKVLGAVNKKGKTMVSQQEIKAIKNDLLRARCEAIYYNVTGSEVS